MSQAETEHKAFRIIDRLDGHARPDTAAEIAADLFAPNASISPKYFYDALGCRLFQAICELPEYYVTRTEAAIFDAYRNAIANSVGTRKQLIDLGAGDCQKAACWFPALDPQRYVAVDVARGIVESALAEFANEMPGTDFVGVIDDFSRTLNLDGVLGPEPVTFFYPGSSIGNFTPSEAVSFMAQTRRYCGKSGTASGSGLLIGVDLVKDETTLVNAYDDAAGVTAAFNKNVLNHIKRLTGAAIDVAAFGHVGLFNRVESRIEMHLEALHETRIALGGRERTFATGERIHTENSCKYEPDKFIAMLGQAGFARAEWWTDAKRHFGVFYAQP